MTGALQVLLLLKLGVLALNLLTFPVLRRAAPGRALTVSLLVPVRNEAHNLPATLPGLLAQPALELLLLDDGSTDGSAGVALEVARRAGAAGRLRVIRGKPLPRGWLGKPWACWQLAGQARGQLLVFTDADVFWEPGALGALLARLERSGADLLTVWPRQRTRSFAERALVPLIDDVLLTLLPYPLVRTPFPSAAAGNGQLMAFRREIYWRVGGHAAVRSDVLEDVRLARTVKAAGGRLDLALGRDRVSVRMYRGFAEVFEGFGKNLRAFHGGSRILVLMSMLLHLALYSLPWLRAADPVWRRLALLGLAERALVNVATGRHGLRDLLEVTTTPLAPLLAVPIYLRALGGRYTWKGREYRR
nr:glycosyltransferase family 2 protein [Deinobacterium chartae]